jgi:hypothetical protein
MAGEERRLAMWKDKELSRLGCDSMDACMKLASRGSFNDSTVGGDVDGERIRMLC